MVKAEYLVVDSGGFIVGNNLWEIGTHVITLNEVINEIRDNATRRRILALPYPLEIRKPSDKAFKVVSDFARKTGDYSTLSAADLAVLAVTYDLEAQHCGTEHLKTEPTVSRTINFYKPSNALPEGDKKIAGFYQPEKGDSKKNKENDFSSFSFWREPIPEIPLDLDLDSLTLTDDKPTDSFQCPLSHEELQNLDSFLEARSFICNFDVCQVDASVAGLLDLTTASKYNNILRWFNHIQSYGTIEQTHKVSLDKIFLKIAEGFDFAIDEVIDDGCEAVSSDEGVGFNESDEDNEDEETDSEDGDDDGNDDDGWITPGNIKEMKDKIQGLGGDVEEDVVVGCMTTDFAMQNVLKQMGLHIIGCNGRIIKHTKTWILRCYACFRTTPELDRKFCPKCGNKTLKRVSVSIDENGKQVVHISTRRELTARGKKFPLPAPRGGKHAANPQLFEDQRMPQQRITKKARMRNNPLDGDWIAGASPFTMNDVTSKSALMGLRGPKSRGEAHQIGHYWDRKNPNANRKRTGNKKKKSNV